MNKNVNTWIEGNGTVRTVFRTLGLYDYACNEACQLRLRKAGEKKNASISAYTLRYAIEKRKREIQWVSLYLPIIAFSVIVLFFIGGWMSSHLISLLYFSIGLIPALSVIFRITWFDQYLKACQALYTAAEILAIEVAGKELPTDEGALVGSPVSNNVEYPIPIAAIEEITSEQKALDIPKEEVLIGVTIEEEGQAVPPVPPITQTAAPEDQEAENIASKGSINTILLHELILQECGRPNIYKGDVHKTVELYAHITGCRPKNILNKTKYYRNREAMNLNTPNSRSTHRKYIDKLLQHYSEIGDETLYNQAEDLQSFIEKLAIRKK